MSTCADVGSFIGSKTSAVQTSYVSFTSEVPDYLEVHTGPGREPWTCVVGVSCDGSAVVSVCREPWTWVVGVSCDCSAVVSVCREPWTWVVGVSCNCSAVVSVCRGLSYHHKSSSEATGYSFLLSLSSVYFDVISCYSLNLLSLFICGCVHVRLALLLLVLIVLFLHEQLIRFGFFFSFFVFFSTSSLSFYFVIVFVLLLRIL